ncbi:hypothetical protein BG003_002135 [Podila horticola]|nr:hypothetical protein BG003_002135 [Podila horticola]
MSKLPSSIELQLEAQLQSRRTRSLLRSLVVIPSTSADFSSNDFLGLARNPRLGARFRNELDTFPQHAPPLGSTGSRLLDGNSQYAEDLEDLIAEFHHAEAALIFNSGFDANVGFFSSVPQPGDVILYDEYIHASVHDGMKVTRAGVKSPFLHNDLDHLGRQLAQVRAEDEKKGKRVRNIFVAVESVYSMDGDTAPLREIVELLEPYGAYLIVDEAHATGVYGTHGRGLVNELGLEDRVFARLHTFSKALASNGAALVGPNVLKQYLINYARPLIYSTFTSFSNLASVKSAYQMLIAGETVEGIVMDGNAKVNALSQRLILAGLNVKAIRFPTVPKGKERVRICLHSHNTLEQVQRLIAIVQQCIQEDNDGSTSALRTRHVQLPMSLASSSSTSSEATKDASQTVSTSSSSSSSSSSSPSPSSSSSLINSLSTSLAIPSKFRDVPTVPINGEMGEIGEMGEPGTLRLLGLWLIRVEIDLGEEAPDEELGWGVDNLESVLDGVIVSWGVSPSWNRVSNTGAGAGETSVDRLLWPKDTPEKVSLLDTDGICRCVSVSVVVICGMAGADALRGAFD